MMESVLNFEEQTTQPWFTYFQIASYCVAMKYRWICIFFILSESPSLRRSCPYKTYGHTSRQTSVKYLTPACQMVTMSIGLQQEHN